MSPAPVRRTAIWSLFGLQLAYWLMLAIAIWAALKLPMAITRTLLIVAPIVPGSLIVAHTVWLYRGCDEFIRLQILRAAALAATLTVLWTMTYSFLEFAGFPRLSMMWVSNIGWAIFVPCMLRLKFSQS